MVDHVLFFRFDEEKLAAKASDAKYKTNGDAQTAKIHSLATIPGVVSVSFGRTFLENRAAGYTHCLAVRLSSKDSLDVYQADPLHVHVRDDFIKPFVLVKPEAGPPLICLDVCTPRVKGTASTKGYWQLAAVMGWSFAILGGIVISRAK